MQAARNLVAAAAELTARMQDGEHHLQGAAPVFHLVDGNAAAVVAHRHTAVGVDGDHDLVAVAGQGLVDRVVDQLPDQVVEAALIGGPDVHAGTPPHGLQALENLDLFGGVRHVGAEGTRAHSATAREVLGDAHEAAGRPSEVSWRKGNWGGGSEYEFYPKTGCGRAVKEPR